MQPTIEQPPEEIAEVTDPAPARRSMKAMFFAMGVILVPVLIGLAFFGLIGGTKPTRVDGPDGALEHAVANATAAHARGDDPMEITLPTGLASAWVPISADYRDGTLRIGYVAPSGAGVQLVESSQSTDDLLSHELGDSRQVTGAQTIGTQTWPALDVREGERALLLTQSPRTIIVVGHAEVTELAQLAGSLGA